MKSILKLFLLLALCGATWPPAAFAQDFAADALADFDTWCRELEARPEAGVSPWFSPTIGPVLDPEERDRYGLLPEVLGFVSARLSRDEQGRPRLEYRAISPAGEMDHRRRLTPEALRRTRLHLWLDERYESLAVREEGPADEAESLYLSALRYAARIRYDLALPVLDDLAEHFPATAAGARADALRPEVRALVRDRKALIWDYTSGNGPGSNDLRLFGGYYGLWLGVGIPLAFEADTTPAYGLGMMAGGPIGLLLSDLAARRWYIDEGQATMIELGGNLGAWQGLGWSWVGDRQGPDVAAAGVLTGLGGIGSAVWLTNRYDFTEGHAALMSASMNWGAWFGMVAGLVMDDEGDALLRDALLGSDALVLAAGLAAGGVQMSEKRVRLIGMTGVIGSMMGLGLDMVSQPDDSRTAWGIVGATGAAGLVLGFFTTGEVDQGRWDDDDELGSANGALEFPLVSLQPDRLSGHGVLPSVGARVRF